MKKFKSCEGMSGRAHRADDLNVGQRTPGGVVFDGRRYRVGQRSKGLARVPRGARVRGGLVVTAAGHQAAHGPARMRVVDAHFGEGLQRQSQGSKFWDRPSSIIRWGQFCQP